MHARVRLADALGDQLLQPGPSAGCRGCSRAAAVAATLSCSPPLAGYVPRPALAGILLWTAWRHRRSHASLGTACGPRRFDRNLALATAFSAVFISIEFSVLIGVFLSFLFFVPRASRLLASELIVSREPRDPRAPAGRPARAASWWFSVWRASCSSAPLRNWTSTWPT